MESIFGLDPRVWYEIEKTILDDVWWFSKETFQRLFGHHLGLSSFGLGQSPSVQNLTNTRLHKQFSDILPWVQSKRFSWEYCYIGVIYITLLSNPKPHISLLSYLLIPFQMLCTLTWVVVNKVVLQLQRIAKEEPRWRRTTRTMTLWFRRFEQVCQTSA